ncbi:signal peptidase I [Bacillus gaemokensis]|uniref:Signal peptidase I n=1 Tax=Bacillus gaemokensis TaxID=574375 RepID=A0A073K5I1_9BACI|nr:signal peptidase I [Bacillus gaemokensis]KEK22549.1 signal peptidase I [Bacillus gaemokensis]KYG34608.1 S26 family signal peptidase [Bacillus gaemokensis]
MKKSRKQEIISWVKTIGITLGIAFIVRGILFTPSLVQGESMMPTLENNERVLVNKIGYNIQGLDRFDIIVFHGKEGYDLVKRVIGLPGDTIEYKNDVLYINGKAVDEPYLADFKQQVAKGKLTPDFRLEQKTGKTEVPEGQVFVLGDNRQVSKDSRMFGFVSEDQIVGKGEAVFWPLQQVRTLQ